MLYNAAVETMQCTALKALLTRRGPKPIALALVAMATAAAQILPVLLPMPSDSIMGFETTAGWILTSSSPFAGVSSTTVRTQGNFALGLVNLPRQATLTSLPVASTASALIGLENTGAGFEVDVMLPRAGNQGSLQLSLSSPSRGLNNQLISQVDLSGFRTGIYSTMGFPIPDTVRSALSGAPFQDLTFKFVLSLPITTGGPIPAQRQYLFDNLRVHSVPPATYDQIVLAERPVAFWDVNPQNGREKDLTGHGNIGTYQNGLPAVVTMPNGDPAADFNGSGQYLEISSNPSFSIPTTGNLTWEAWIRPDILQFPDETPDGYVDFMGKCATYSPTCEWESRMYSARTHENPNRPNRVSAYVYNPPAGLGSGANWQPAAGLLLPGEWLHVVGEYTTRTAPSDCPDTATYPGSINIWVNGVPWNQLANAPTGCMSQYRVIPRANNSPLNIGTMALDSYFKGAIGKVAIYNYLLTQTQISNHYEAMTGKQPQGSCSDTCSF